MSASVMQETPAVPPRPSRSADKSASTSTSPMPAVPPRPVNKRLERSVSPNHDRFAQSPLNAGFSTIKSPTKANYLSPGYDVPDDPIERSGSVSMPNVGEEGIEYSAITKELQHEEEESEPRVASPEQTRTIGEDVKLHAPKPSLPAVSAKQRVAAVTRTDSDRAASLGFGQLGHDSRAASRGSHMKRASSTFSAASDHGHYTDEEHGIPEIGQRVPMNPYLGDVQAPSPGPEPEAGRNHARKHSARGLPPGSYGLHGHGVQPLDKLEQEWYQKHPEQLQREQNTPLHDRQNDFAMSSADLNRLVRDTASRGAVFGTPAEVYGTPSDEVAFQASEEYVTRRSSSRPTSAAAHVPSPLTQSFKSEDKSGEDEVIHVDDASHPEYRSYGNEDPQDDIIEPEYPVLAADEVNKHPRAYIQHPAIHPVPEHRAGGYESGDAAHRPISRGSSRPSSRPTSMHHNNSQGDFPPTPLEDVREYEPLFQDDSKAERKKREEKEYVARHHFPSKDIWEDAPHSVHHTAQVTTPDVPPEHRRKSSSHLQERPLTPAQAFALHQEELAERESRQGGVRGVPTNKFLSLSEDKPTWVGHQSHLQAERPRSNHHRFPSRDIWEDAPESQLHQTTVMSPPAKEEETQENDVKPEMKPKPEIPSRPTKKGSPERPAVPDRPRPKQAPSDENIKVRPPVSDKPKPQIPARPSKSLSGDSKSGEPVSKPKPPVPSRPVGGKIAALQAGFMSDLNKRLQLGPQGPKKEDSPEEEGAPEKEKAPLSDARKSRARGPQRRAPAKTAAPAVSSSAATKTLAPTLSFAVPSTTWLIRPDDGELDVSSQHEEENPAPQEPSLTQEPEALTEPSNAPQAAHPKVAEASTEKDEAKEDEAKVDEAKEDEAMSPDTAEEIKKPHDKPEAEDKQQVEETHEVKETQQEEDAQKIEDTQKVEETQRSADPAETPHTATELDVGDVNVSSEKAPASATEDVQGISSEIMSHERPVEATEEGTPEKEEKTLVANTAGESILETTVEKKDGGKDVEPVDVDDAVKS